MSKKVISLLLAVMLTAAMIVVAAISVSADTDDEGSYVPSEGTETYHIYFCKPDDWENKYTSDAGVYWENGSDTPSAWRVIQLAMLISKMFTVLMCRPMLIK